MMRIPRQEIDRRIQWAAKMLSIEMLLQRKPRDLSGGQRQRVALGRAIVREPACFLLDEPLSNLDAKLRVTMRAELKRLHHEIERTFIYVTHDQAEALTMSDRIAIMNHGKLQQFDTPDVSITTLPTSLAASLAIRLNFIEGEIVNEVGTPTSRGALRYRFSLLRPTLTGAGAPAVIMGVRPEPSAATKPPGIAGTVYVDEPLARMSFSPLMWKRPMSLCAPTPNSAPTLGSKST
jgi:multiple sugar transport system ATP-binding protein